MTLRRQELVLVDIQWRICSNEWWRNLRNIITPSEEIKLVIPVLKLKLWDDYIYFNGFTDVWPKCSKTPLGLLRDIFNNINCEEGS